MTEAKKQILDFAHSLQTTPRRPRRTKFKVLPPTKEELYVPLSRMKDLMSLRSAKEQGLIHGQMSYLSRMAAIGTLKAAKITGMKGWQVLPEWIEEFNNLGLHKRYVR